MKEAMPLQWDSACRSHVGKVRKLNEDAVLERPDRGLWVVADGMGGHAAGDFASTSVVDALNDIQTPASLGALLGDVRQRLQTVNRTLSEEARRRRQEVIGSTVVVLVLFGTHAVVLWAGDSRAYLYRGGELKQLTRDHSQVEEFLSLGLITPEQVEGHPASNIITRAVGVAEYLDVDSEMFEIQAGDTLLLCSDGLYRELDEAEIRRCLAGEDCQQACEALLNGALAEGARDNVSVVVARVLQEEQVTHTHYNPSVKAPPSDPRRDDDPTCI
jgi:protein phosphatase